MKNSWGCVKEMNANAWKVSFIWKCFFILLGGKMRCSASNKTTLSRRKKSSQEHSCFPFKFYIKKEIWRCVQCDHGSLTGLILVFEDTILYFKYSLFRHAIPSLWCCPVNYPNQDDGNQCFLRGHVLTFSYLSLSPWSWVWHNAGETRRVHNCWEQERGCLPEEHCLW